MFCSSCGKMIPDDAKFCRYCGADNAQGNGVPQEGVPESVIPVSQPVEESVPQNVSDKSHSIKGFLILCVVALAIAGGLMYLRSGNTLDYDTAKLTTYTYSGTSTKLYIDLPFELKDNDAGKLDETVVSMIDKGGGLSNIAVEVIGIKYNVDMSNLDEKIVLETISNFASEEPGISKPVLQEAYFATANGNKCAKQIMSYYDRTIKENVESLTALFIKDGDIWAVSITYKKGDKDANAYAEKLINTIVIK